MTSQLRLFKKWSTHCWTQKSKVIFQHVNVNQKAKNRELSTNHLQILSFQIRCTLIWYQSPISWNTVIFNIDQYAEIIRKQKERKPFLHHIFRIASWRLNVLEVQNIVSFHEKLCESGLIQPLKTYEHLIPPLFSHMHKKQKTEKLNEKN